MSIAEKFNDALFRIAEPFRAKGPDLGYAPRDGRFLHVMMDLVERCNLRCTHCAFVYWRDEILEGNAMSHEILEKVGEEVFPHSERVSLSCFHEPTMVPNRLIRGIELCREKGVPNIDFITNGLLFTERLARDVFMAKPTRMYFSVDGASPETYDKVRLGGTFEQFVPKMQLAVRERDKVAKETGHYCQLSFIGTMMKSNVHDAPKLVDLAADNGIDIVELRYLVKTDAATVDESELLIYAQEESDAAFDEAVSRGAERGVTMELIPDRFRDIRARAEEQAERPTDWSTCRYPWNTLVIAPKGDVYPCCLWHGDDKLDEIKTKSFAKVWDGQSMRRLRRELLSGNLGQDACKQCFVHHDMSRPEYWKTHHFRGS